MDENRSKKIFKIGFFISSAILFLLILKVAGVFNFLYVGKLNKILDKDIAFYNQYLKHKINISGSIGEDKIIQSSLIQFNYKNQFMDAFKHLSLYKQNYKEIRGISLFNSMYEIVLASEMDERIINNNINKDWFLNANTKGHYVSEVSYANKYNEFLVSIVLPIRNIIDETIGYLLVDFSMFPLFSKFDQFEETVVVIKKQNKYILTYPLNQLVDKDHDLNKFSKIVNKNLSFDSKFYVAATNKYFALPGYLIFILVLFFTICVLFTLYYFMDKYSETMDSRSEKLKKVTQDVLSYAKNMTIKKQVIKKQTEDDFYEDRTYVAKPKGRDLKKIDKVQSGNKTEKKSEEGFMYIN